VEEKVRGLGLHVFVDCGLALGPHHIRDFFPNLVRRLMADWLNIDHGVKPRRPVSRCPMDGLDSGERRPVGDG